MKDIYINWRIRDGHKERKNQMITDEQFTLLEKYIKESNNIVFFGGAGVSTESGIPDFRSKDGLYNNMGVDFSKYKPEYLLSSVCLHNEPEVFFEFYKQKMDTRKFKPNITHEVLAKLERMGKLSAVVTQNIDGLHQKAGSKTVYEIHGTTARCHCIICDREYNGSYIFDSNESVPHCQYCKDKKAIVRPNIVLYGENLSDYIVAKAIPAIKKADCLIIGGTSLTVWPAYTFISYFRGDHLIIINNEPLDIPVNEEMDLNITDTLGNVFTKIDKMIKE